MTTTSDTELQSHIAATLLSLATLLEFLPADEFDAPSLCEGWRVRHVVAHMTMAARYSEAEFMTMLADVNFDFPTLSNRVADDDSQRPVAALIADLRDDTLHHWTPPGGGWRGALNHAAIHALDVTVPLRQPRPVSDDALRVILDDLTTGGVHAHFGVDLSGKSFSATDLNWSYGPPPADEAPAEQIAVRLCGRALPM